MDHWKRSKTDRVAAWEQLDNVIDPDVALLQEAVPPPERTGVYQRGGIDRHSPWGSAVVTKDLAIEEVTQAKAAGGTFDLLRHHPGCVAIGRVQPEGVEPITFVSLHGRLNQGWAITTLHNLISDLSPLFISKHGKRLVLGGDLNGSTQLSRPWRYFHRNLSSASSSSASRASLLGSKRSSGLRTVPARTIHASMCRPIATQRALRHGKRLPLCQQAACQVAGPLRCARGRGPSVVPERPPPARCRVRTLKPATPRAQTRGRAT
jgi:hypothetical protein